MRQILSALKARIRILLRLLELGENPILLTKYFPGRNARTGPYGISVRPVTVEWMTPPPIPGGYAKYNTFDADKIRPSGLPRGRRGSITLETIA